MILSPYYSGSVNLGGWLNTEPFISPALYEQYLNAPTPAIDEWTLSVNMAADTKNGGFAQLEQHYATFIVCIYVFPQRRIVNVTLTSIINTSSFYRPSFRCTD